MKIRIEADPQRLLDFLEEMDYPNKWDLDVLRGHCISLRIEEGRATVAYVWAHWSEEAPTALEFHACASDDARGLWLTPALLTDLCRVADWLDARSILTRPSGPRAAPISRLLRRLGFQDRGEFLHRNLEDT